MEDNEPKSCCFCFDTKNASLIIASLNLIGSFLFFALASSTNGIFAFVIQAALEPLIQNHSLDEVQIRFIISRVCIAVLTLTSLSGICSCLLIHGIRKDRPPLMLPYLLFHAFMLLISSITGIGSIILSIYFHVTLGTSSVFYKLSSFSSSILFMGTLLESYFSRVMNAYHKKVERALSENHSILREDV